ncbi:MFS transporter [Nocardioides ginsengisoli]|uniref:MFS transporter n=1 Tax=Nocardioides ginsengisoli TaxID=363868 RepID=A0ABW3W2L0_9ACTN
MVTVPDSAVPPSGHSAAAPERWTPRLVFSLVSIVLLLEMLTISYLMISMALPTIAAHYQTNQVAWLLTAFLLFGAVAAPLVGRLADLHGKRRMLLVCVAGAALGSLISAVAGSYGMLIAGRALTGLLVPCLFLSYSLIRDVFPPRTVALAVSVATSGMGLIAIPAPFLTGWLIDNHGFRSIFWFALIGLAVLGVLIALTTDESPLRSKARLDFVGAILLGGGIAGVLVAVSFGPTWGWTDAKTLTYLLGGAALVVGWLVSARTVREPLIDVDVLRRRPVLLTTISAGFVYGASALFTMLLPMIAMTPAILGLGYGFGLTAEGYAVFQAPIGAMGMVGGLVMGLLVSRKVRPQPLLVAGLVTMAAGFFVVGVAHDSKGLLVVLAGVFGFGQGLGYAAVPNLLIAAVPPQLQASTASIVGVFQSAFPAILPVIVFAVLNNSYVAPLPPEMTGGAVLYTNDGYLTAFLISAGATAIGAVVALMLPRTIQQVETDAVAVDGSVALAH